MLRYATLVVALVVMLLVARFMLGAFSSKYRHVERIDIGLISTFIRPASAA